MRKTHINADMSHENRLSYQFGEFLDSLKTHGIFPTIRKIGQRFYYKVKGIDFATQNIYDLTRTGEYTEHGTALVSTSKDFFAQLMSDLEGFIPKPIEKNVFIDYGSGKGAAIIHAKSFGFKKTIGIEFAKELNDIARENIKKLNLKNIESLYADATTYSPPKDVSVIYLFNPFDVVVMEKVIENLKKEKQNFENDVYLIYGNASCHVIENNLQLLGKKVYPSGATADFYKV